MLIHDLNKKGLIQPPKFLADNVSYMTIMGSMAYGVSSDASDEDIYGFCIPPKEQVFPHLAGEIIGFGTQKQRFDNWQQHHVKTLDGRKTYDFSIYSIVRYFSLCMENNPNMIDSMFTPETCVKHITEVGRMVRDRRRLFLHKGAWHKFKGYAYSQVNKMDVKGSGNQALAAFRNYCDDNEITYARGVEIAEQPTEYVSRVIQSNLRCLLEQVNATGSRYRNVLVHGYDLKFAYHVVRLLSEVEQIMVDGDLDLQRNREQLKSIRRGEWSQDEIKEYFARKEPELESLYLSSKLQHAPDENAIKQLLMDCLEQHYGTISQMTVIGATADQVIDDLKALIDRYAG